MNRKFTALTIAAFFLVAAAFYAAASMRYEIVSINSVCVARLDRLTGQVVFISLAGQTIPGTK